MATTEHGAGKTAVVYNGRTLFEVKPPRRGWKCTACALQADCGIGGMSGLPSCFGDRREDGRDVIFVERGGRQ